MMYRPLQRWRDVYAGHTWRYKIWRFKRERQWRREAS